MNVYRREMKAHGKSLMIWSFGVLFLIVAGMAKYAGYETSGQSVNDLIAQMPKALQSIMGMGAFDLSKAIGFYGTLSLYLFVMVAIHGALIGVNIIAKEELDKTAEFLFVKPISRGKVIAQKMLAGFTNLVILNVVASISSIMVVEYYSNGEEVTGSIINLMIGMFILQLIYFFIGTAIVALSKGPKKAAGIATTTLLLTFILSIFIDINSNLENLKYLTPFKYFEAKTLLLDARFDLAHVLLSLLLILLSGMVTYIFYRRRDLNV